MVLRCCGSLLFLLGMGEEMVKVREEYRDLDWWINSIFSISTKPLLQLPFSRSPFVLSFLWFCWSSREALPSTAIVTYRYWCLDDLFYPWIGRNFSFTDNLSSLSFSFMCLFLLSFYTIFRAKRNRLVVLISHLELITFACIILLV